MDWNQHELREALTAYERALLEAGLQPITIHSYVDYSRRFLRWRLGDFAPRGTHPSALPQAHTRRVNAQELEADLLTYESVLQSAGLQPMAVHTYVDQARRFVAWLDGTYRPRGGPGERSRPSPAGPPQVPPRPPTAVAASGSAPELPGGWTSEAAVQSAVVAWLVRQDWSIVRVAQTSSREHGADIVARRDGVDLLVEVKGYPSEAYSTGDRAAQARRYNPATQARTYFGNALLAVLVMRDESPGADIILALPDVQTYRGLVDKVKGSLATLRIRVLFVDRDGAVSETSAPA